MANILVTKTQDDIFNDYLTRVKSLNPKINPDIEGSDFWLKAKVLGGILSGVYQDVNLNALNIYIQTSSGIFVDKNLSSWGLPSRAGATFAVSTVGLSSAPSSGFSLTAGTLLSSDSSGVQYTVIVDTIVTVTDYQNINIICTQIGTGFQLPLNSTVTLQIPIVAPPITQFVVFSSTDGQLAETDASCIQRNLFAVQNPKLGGSLNDYKGWIIDGNKYLTGNIITNSVVIPNIISNGLVGCFGFGGADATDVLLNQGVVGTTTFVGYDRMLSAPAITAFNRNVFENKPLNDNILSKTNETFTLPDFSSVGGYIRAQVSLINGYTLDTLLTIDSIDSSDNVIQINITIRNLIKREIRRAITTIQFGAVPIYDSNTNSVIGRYIPISTIEQFIDTGLSALEGQEGIYASIILSRKLAVYNGSSYIYSDITGLPLLLNENVNIEFTYDVLYTNINIEVL